MIDLATEQLVAVRDIPRHLPRRPTGKRVHISACYRWLARGVRGVKLEAIRIGGTTYTSVEALQRFAERLNSATSRPLSEPTPSQARRKAIDRAARELDAKLNPPRGGNGRIERPKRKPSDEPKPQGETK